MNISNVVKKAKANGTPFKEVGFNCRVAKCLDNCGEAFGRRKDAPLCLVVVYVRGVTNSAA